jgi:Ca2+-binding EF-hand superfamily protein
MLDPKVAARLQQDVLEAAKIAYAFLDTEKKGSVSPERLIEVDDAKTGEKQRYDPREEADFKSEFRNYDADGGVDFEEFYDLIIKTLKDPKLLDSGLSDAFKVFDRRNKDVVTAEDFRKTMESMGEHISDDELHEVMEKAAVSNGADFGIGESDFKEFSQFPLYRTMKQ